jgi:GT2 family glycosyltransferase
MVLVLAAILEGILQVIPVLGFATLSRFDLAQRLLDSIDYPVKDLVIVNNSGRKSWEPVKPELVENLWHLEVPHGLGANGAWNLIIKSTPHAPYWVLPNDDAWFEPNALARIADEVDTTRFNFVDIQPIWSCVIPTEGSVKRAGLWSERFHPIYFDDDEYHWRMERLGVGFNHIPARVNHDNSSTLKSGYQERNNATFRRNGIMLQEKKQLNDLKEWGWSLETRRLNSWD